MRRLLTYLAVLCAAAVLAAMGTRLTRAEHAAQAQQEGQLAATRESMEQLTLALEKTAVAEPGAEQAEALLAVARTGNLARTQLTALPMAGDTAAAVTAVLNEVTGQADALLCALAAGDAPTDEALAALVHQQALCRRLCTQLMLLDDPAPGALELLSPAVCCDGEHDAPVPVLARRVPIGLPQQTITQEEALTLSAHFVGARTRSVSPAPGAGGVLPAYGVTVETDDLRLNLEVTRHGGKLLWMLPETASFAVQRTQQEARSAVDAYLRQLGLGYLQEVAWQLTDGLYTAVMAPTQEQMLLYPDLIHVQVRMDTAEVVGFEAAQYWTNHTARTPAAPAVSAAQVLEALPQGMQQRSVTLALLPDGDGERLCYQVHAVRGDDDYLLFYDAQTGRQAAIRRLLITGSGVYPA